ncbi:MAG: carbon starvation CstA family protein, partial [Myxococcales bacterium]
LAYCFLASVLPMWTLLQPRGMLGGWFLYGALGVAVLGIALGGYTMQYPAFLGWSNPRGMPLFPLMFITIACGACSGFHGLVCSGTTSKQLAKESHARGVGYGGMLLEGGVALIALCTVVILPLGDPGLKLDPNVLYARGLAKFASSFGIPTELAASFGLLAFATFVYDTLDVATRLGRYVLQELTGWSGRTGAFLSTGLTLGVPAGFLLTATDKAYMKFWGVFGASNQLLAALSLLGIAVWLKRIGKPTWVALAPMSFVMVMTVWSLGLQARTLDAAGVTCVVLLGVAFTLVLETVRALKTTVAAQVLPASER